MSRSRRSIAVFASLLAITAAGAQQPSVAAGQDRTAAERLVAQATSLRSKQDKESLRDAIGKLEQSLPLWELAADDNGRAGALTMLGAIHRSLGTYPRALAHLEEALTLRRRIGDPARTAEALSEIGAVYQFQGDLQKALGNFTEARDLARSGGDRSREAIAANGMGRVYDARGEYDEALLAYGETLSLARASGDRRAEAAAIGNLGRLQQAAGETQKALEHFREALTHFEALDDRARQAIAIHAIGAVYQTMGQPRRAIGFYQQAVVIFRTVGNRRLAANTLNTLGIAQAAIGEHAQALRLLNEALTLAQEVGDLRVTAYTLHNLGDVHRGTGERRKALDFQRQALPLRRAVHDRSGEARVLIEIGSLSLLLGEDRPARAAFDEGLAIARELLDRPGEALARAGLARVERSTGDLAAARVHLEAALDLVESVRNAAGIRELRASYLASAHGLYELYIDLLMQLHKTRPLEGFGALALNASERGRARSLVDLLSESESAFRHIADPALLERKRSLQRRLNAKAEWQMRLLGDGASPAQVAAAAADVDRLVVELEELDGRIRAGSRRYAARTQPAPLTATDIQRQVLDAGTLLLEYSLGDDRSYVWAVTQTTVNTYELPGRTEIEPLARRVHELLTARQPRTSDSAGSARTRFREADAALPAAAAALSEILLRPVAAHLEARRLLIVPDGALRYLPFAALPLPGGTSGVATEADGAGSGAPLIVRHEVVSLPSASALAVLGRQVATRDAFAGTVAVLADPVFDAADERVAKGVTAPHQSQAQTVPAHEAAREFGAVGAGGRIGRLPFTRREAESILSLVPGGRGLKAVDFLASRATLTSGALRKYQILHVATHGFLNDDQPNLSGLVLSLVDERGNAQDGFLRLHELYDLEIPAELVVLSACQTALGKESKGEGLVGLTSGLMHAGAARVLASLWKVDDAATAELMKRFYAGMLGEQKLAPAAALRAAQLSMSRQKRWSAPYYWAAFVLQGGWEKLSSPGTLPLYPSF